jgi:hypothetical protein
MFAMLSADGAALGAFCGFFVSHDFQRWRKAAIAESNKMPRNSADELRKTTNCVRLRDVHYSRKRVILYTKPRGKTNE